jgi:hypothetical protein
MRSDVLDTGAELLRLILKQSLLPGISGVAASTHTAHRGGRIKTLLKKKSFPWNEKSILLLACRQLSRK